MKKKAFTLIELLVVMAVIGILVSILLPALRKAKYQARMLLDSTNLKTLASSMGLYLTKSEGKFFPYPSTPGDVLWLKKIGENIDDIDEIRYCPETTMRIEDVEREFDGTNSIRGEALRPWLWNNSPSSYERYEMGSYGINGWFYADNNSWVPSSMAKYPFSSAGDVRNTAKTPLFLDANWPDSWPTNTNVLTAPTADNNYDRGWFQSGTTGLAMGRFVTNRHGRKTNVAFMDMHVETLTLEQLWSLSWHKGAQPNFAPALPTPLPREK